MELLVTERGNLGTVPFPLALLGSLRRLLASPHASGLVHLGPLPAPPAVRKARTGRLCVREAEWRTHSLDTLFRNRPQSAELHAARVQAHELAQLPSEAARVRATPWFDAYVACSTCARLPRPCSPLATHARLCATAAGPSSRPPCAAGGASSGACGYGL